MCNGGGGGVSAAVSWSRSSPLNHARCAAFRVSGDSVSRLALWGHLTGSLSRAHYSDEQNVCICYWRPRSPARTCDWLHLALDSPIPRRHGSHANHDRQITALQRVLADE